ncbi:MAG: preprotein translocase subunit SecY [Candidatus Helarchaeota archaeon]|nr:preprotein translocase subunit SecY [Candidatus Helarchaeota archaeon]
MTSRFLRVFSPFVKIMPEVKPPEREVSFKEKFAWTALVLIIYLIMSNIPLAGVPRGEGTDYFFWWRVLLASQRGTLAELGIGPIVTAGLIMQLLAGSQIIKVDFSDPRDRSLFTGVQKVLAVIMTLVQIIAYLAAGAYGSLNFIQQLAIFGQLFVAGIIIILLDELLQKGWGLGSGVSLFIAAGVAMQIIWLCFSPFGAEDGFNIGIVIALFQVIGGWGARRTFTIEVGEPAADRTFTGVNNFGSIWDRRPMVLETSGDLPAINPNLPTMLGLITTIIIVVIVIFLETVRVEIPLQYAKYRGFKGKYPIKLLYVSNIPVILVQALYANALFFGQLLFRAFGTNPFVKFFANFSEKATGQGASQYWQPSPGCVLYYLTPPRNIQDLAADPLRAIIYMVILVVLCVWFSKIWVDVSGIAPRDISHQILRAGLMVPGFRPTPRVLERILERYIPTVTTIGAICVGLLASGADFLGALGTGMGILLTVGIIYQYYQIIAQEQMASMNPAMRGLLGLE